MENKRLIAPSEFFEEDQINAKVESGDLSVNLNWPVLYGLCHLIKVEALEITTDTSVKKAFCFTVKNEYGTKTFNIFMMNKNDESTKQYFDTVRIRDTLFETSGVPTSSKLGVAYQTLVSRLAQGPMECVFFLSEGKPVFNEKKQRYYVGQYLNRMIPRYTSDMRDQYDPAKLLNAMNIDELNANVLAGIVQQSTPSTFVSNGDSGIMF